MDGVGFKSETLVSGVGSVHFALAPDRERTEGKGKGIHEGAAIPACGGGSGAPSESIKKRVDNLL
jgi:hypothetical protein